MRKQGGFSLIEVLLAWGLASSALMTLLSYQHHALVQVQQTERGSQMMSALSGILQCLQRYPSLYADGDWLAAARERVSGLGSAARLSVQCSASACRGRVDWQYRGQQHLQLAVSLISDDQRS